MNQTPRRYFQCSACGWTNPDPSSRCPVCGGSEFESILRIQNVDAQRSHWSAFSLAALLAVTTLCAVGLALFRIVPILGITLLITESLAFARTMAVLRLPPSITGKMLLGDRIGVFLESLAAVTFALVAALAMIVAGMLAGSWFAPNFLLTGTWPRQINYGVYLGSAAGLVLFVTLLIKSWPSRNK